MKTKCPRQDECSDVFTYSSFEYLNKPDDGTCDFCGSLVGDMFMKRIEDGDVILSPTDKNYKVYIKNDGGEPFHQTYRIDEPSKPGEIMKDPMDQSKWEWTTKESSQVKFYFEHLDEEQKKHFVDLLNSKKLKLDYPGHFYRMPYFIKSS